jgi:hypothetical protein
MAKIKLGSTAVDKASGYKGVITAKVEMINGNVQYAIVPKAKVGVGEYPAGVQLDDAQLDIVDEGISDTAATPMTSDIKIGEKVKDLVTGLSGIVTSKTTFLNGCLYLMVSVKSSEKKDVEIFIPVERAERQGPGISAKLIANKPTHTGGPATRLMRAC